LQKQEQASSIESIPGDERKCKDWRPPPSIVIGLRGFICPTGLEVPRHGRARARLICALQNVGSMKNQTCGEELCFHRVAPLVTLR
jgi:hypothetical protein